jgi:PadR family transcriptional regulator PadR
MDPLLVHVTFSAAAPTLGAVPRRRAGVLLPLEEAILRIGLRRLSDGEPEFYGFAVATDLDGTDGRRLTAHGTLYKVLDRLEREGLLVSRWETPDEVDQSRPRRRLYQVSEEAAPALSRSRALVSSTALRPGLVRP